MTFPSSFHVNILVSGLLPCKARVESPSPLKCLLKTFIFLSNVCSNFKFLHIGRYFLLNREKLNIRYLKYAVCLKRLPFLIVVAKVRPKCPIRHIIAWKLIKYGGDRNTSNILTKITILGSHLNFRS